MDGRWLIPVNRAKAAQKPPKPQYKPRLLTPTKNTQLGPGTELREKKSNEQKKSRNKKKNQHFTGKVYKKIIRPAWRRTAHIFRATKKKHRKRVQ